MNSILERTLHSTYVYGFEILKIVYNNKTVKLYLLS